MDSSVTTRERSARPSASTSSEKTRRPFEVVSPASSTLPSSSARASSELPTSLTMAPFAGASSARPGRAVSTVARTVPGPSTGAAGNDVSRHALAKNSSNHLKDRIEHTPARGSPRGRPSSCTSPPETPSTTGID
jgi:hypothetical protein